MLARTAALAALVGLGVKEMCKDAKDARALKILLYFSSINMNNPENKEIRENANPSRRYPQGFWHLECGH